MTTDKLFDENPERDATAPLRELQEAAPQRRTNLLAAVRAFTAAQGDELNVSLDDLSGRTDEEVAAMQLRIVEAVSLTLRGVAIPAVKGLEIQLENFATWQARRGNPYFEWPVDAMDRLRAKLLEYGAGIELQLCYAHSVWVRLPDGGEHFHRSPGQRVD